MMTVNQNLKPITTEINSKGNLQIGGCDLVKLATEYFTPLYVLDEQTIRQACREYKDAFKSYDNVKLMYASKALCTIATTKLLMQENFGFDVVSGGELYTVYSAGANMADVLFNGNNKSADELSYAINLNVGRISVDNFSEIELINKIAQDKNKTVEVLLRVTPGIECHTHEYIKTGTLDSKFGFDLSQVNSAVDIILKSCQNVKLKGFHAHIGSQIFETTVYADEIDILVDLLAKTNNKYGLLMNEINIGGGLGVKYVQEDEPPSVYDVANIIVEKVNKSKIKNGISDLKLIIEPGRSIISTAGVTLYSIGSSKQVPNGTKYVSIDGGMADNTRHSMYKANYFAQLANKPKGTSLQKVTIAGRFCESGDILIRDINLPNPEKTDILCVFNTGAYNYSMASNYNRVQKPAMVLVNNSQSDMIIKRETLNDIVSHDVVPNRWC